MEITLKRCATSRSLSVSQCPSFRGSDPERRMYPERANINDCAVDEVLRRHRCRKVYVVLGELLERAER